MKNPQRVLIPISILLVLMLLVFCFIQYFEPYRLILLIAFAVAAVAIIVAAAIVLSKDTKQIQKRMDSIFLDNSHSATDLIMGVSVPCLLADANGQIVWRNDSMEKLIPGKTLKNILPDYNFENPAAAIKFNYANSSYQILSMQVKRRSTDRNLTFQYWLDRTEAAHYQRLYEENRPYIALIYVDNFDELISDRQFHRTAVLTEIERLIAQTAESLEGVYRWYENGRFFLVFEAKHLQELEDGKFSLLEAARQIDTGTNVGVSLSIGVGVADYLSQSNEGANQALELALGRGGDQAIVKNGINYSFYGGKLQLDSLQSRVKTRLFAKAMRQLFENSGDIIIMGHRNADMDCFGSALGIAACAKTIGSRCFIVLDDRNETIDVALDVVKSNASYASCIVSPEQAEHLFKPSSVLVIVDTQRIRTVVAPRLIEMASRIVLIDHHRRSADYIDTSTLHLLESRASSASELITEVIQYFDDNMKIPAFVCSALLAGITVDTKHFAFNVGSRTFEAAGYLRKNGADISMVKQMFQDDMASYQACSEAVRNAEILPGGIAISKCLKTEGCEENEKLIAAKVADQLINIKGITAGFALAYDGNIISVSGRSLGAVNTQIICEKLGGGGHLTMSGAQLHDIDIDAAYDLVKTQILEYVKEVEPE